ncbi:unnamed protein product [Paramecium pentaurelia]|uniref:Uncharacterized protein n=1 Tax=Paramecium pentaurelia TaxID=43138 RepID=A0A8S1Y6A9_9CILI|nr:unnamed protein product [Paramecium pentaurelia]
MNQKFTKEQQLLVDEIINKGYNQDDFEDFVLLKEPNRGQDLTQWTYKELLRIIQLYQQEKKEKQSDSYQLIELDSPDISDQIQIIDRDTFVKKQTQESIKIVYYFYNNLSLD